MKKIHHKFTLPRPLKSFYKKHRVTSLVIALVLVTTIIGGTVRAVITNSGDVQLQKGLVGWWKLDGNAKDSSPYGYNGTVTGSVNLTTDRFGKANSAYEFPGGTNSHYIDTNNMNLYTTFTISVWAYPTTTTQYQAILSTGRDSTNNNERGFNLMANYSTMEAQFSIVRSDGGGFIYATAPNNTTTTNEWQHFVGSYDGTNLKLYRNGVLVGSNTYTQSSMGTPLRPLYFGRMPGHTCCVFDGKVDDVRYYNRTLSADEVTALYEGEDSNASTVKLAEGQRQLLGHWKFNGNAKDSSPYGNNATVTGATLTTDRHGNANSAYSFNGTSDYIDTGIATMPNKFTISGWFNADTTSNMILASNTRDCCDNNNRGFNLMAIYSGAVTSMNLWKIDGSGSVGTNGSAVTAGQWIHLAYTYDGTTQRLYQNGVQVATNSYSQASNGTPTSTLKIGRLGSVAGIYMDGKIDDVRFYSDALSSNEVSQIYSSYDSSLAFKYDPLEQGLIGHWKFNGNADDSTPFGNHGIIYGNVTLTTDRNGASNKAYDFDHGYIDTGSYVLPDQFTFSAWFNPDVAGTQSIASNSRNCCESYPTPMRGWYIAGKYSAEATGVLWYSNGMGALSSLNGGNPSTGSWHHIAMTYDGTALKFYLNGNLSFTVTYSQSTNGGASTSTLQFGTIAGFYAYGAGYNFNGKLDDMRYYNRALNSTEVNTVMNDYDG